MFKGIFDVSSAISYCGIKVSSTMFKRITVRGVSLSSAHHPKTLSLTLSGKEAYKTTASNITDTLMKERNVSPKDIVALYQFEEPLKWFIKLGKEAEQNHFESLLGRTFHAGPGMVMDIEQVGRERQKVIVHWVPPTLPKEGVEEMLSFLSKDPVEAYPHRGRPDRWTVLYRPDQEAIVPHYIFLECGQVRGKRILLLVPGRKQACFLCGSQEHWTSKCGRKIPVREGLVERTGEGERDNKNKPSVPVTNKTAVSSAVPDALPVPAPVPAPSAATLATTLTSPVADPATVPVTVPVATSARGSTAGESPGRPKAYREDTSATPEPPELEEGWQIKTSKKTNTNKQTEKTSGGSSPQKRSYADAVSNGSPPNPQGNSVKAWTAAKRHFEDDCTVTQRKGTKVQKYDWFPQDLSSDEND